MLRDRTRCGPRACVSLLLARPPRSLSGLAALRCGCLRWPAAG